MLPNRPSFAADDKSATPTWLNETAELAAWQSGKEQEPIGIDTEFVRERTYWPVLALVQARLPDRPAALIDPTTANALPLLGQILSQSDTVIMHSAGEDLIALKPLLPAPMLGLYDTQIAGAFAGLGLGLGYQGTVEQLTGIHLEKQETRSNWLARPLSERQVDYALDDVRYLHELHEQLDQRLEERGYRAWHAEDCRRIAESGFELAPDPQPQLSMRGAWRWSPEAQAQLRRILLWRDETARARNLPKRWVLDDESAQLAAIDPAHSAARLAAHLTKGPPGRARSLQPLLNLIAEPPTADEIESTLPIAEPLEGEHKQTLKRLKAEIDAEAARLDIPPGLLCPRRVLETLIMTRTWPDDLHGWRSGLIEARLVSLL